MNERIEKLRAFLQQQPDDCFLNHALALEYVKTGHDAEARRLFEQNRLRDGSYIATYYHLGKLLERMGDAAQALEVYEAGMLQAKQANDRHSYNELQAAHEDLAY